MTPVPIPVQARYLAEEFPNGEVKSQSLRRLKWEMNIVPTPNSSSYRIRIDYTIGASPKIYVVEPAELKKAQGEILLPHVFDTEKQQLCLFYGRIGEWNSSMLLSRTIVPWAAEWLYYYELWVITGEWLGGGIGHSRKTPYTKKDSLESKEQ